MSSQPDAQLVAAINRRDASSAAAFEALYLRHRDWVTGLAYRFTREHALALDVMQESFMYLLRKFDAPGGLVLTANLKTLLYPAVRHLAIAAKQKRERFTTADPQPVLDAAPAAMETPGASSGFADTKAELRAVMESLPEAQRETVLLRFVDDLSMQEIAEALGVPVGTVKSRLHNALATLRADPRVRKYFEVEDD